MHTSKAERERLRALRAKAMPGPWVVEDATIFGPGDVGVADSTTENAALIAAAVNALPALLDDLDEAEKVFQVTEEMALHIVGLVLRSE